ncbi:hypothetical protein L226DRAFT_459950 [Lentinus tigrinus ALCF2SS1-7]|uniref:uncharacterized protein n=1 Tax=Lentinus tigrinus ALCF2SS1-7 TaxID=1328758 RepID=UPI0011661F2E|nr:hypothetical protein L226DRAFT_459950 [Lentinus tigrinus ALCF2SS1-7]
MPAALAASIALVCAALFAWFYMAGPDANTEDAPKPAYILENQVTHARLLPTPSTHAFTYPTLAFLVSLDALEAHSLDLARGWLFGYGGTAWRVTGLRSGAYLGPGSQAGERRNGLGGSTVTIKEKLREVLEQFGHDGGRLGEVWMLTMPSYMGYEGINPLTVHYCYEKGGERLVWVVLEIHNTFGEKHVHVLETGVGEDAGCPPGYHHQWTFARDFHVSPFNDRLGHYTVSVNAPPAPSSPELAPSSLRPKIRIHLHAASSPSPPPSSDADAGPSKSTVGPLKLTATLFARRAVPLTSTNLLRALARYPLALFLSFARILYHAWILHYVKRLDVFPRPDPKPAMRAWGLPGVTASSPAEEGEAEKPRRAHGGIGWQDEGPLEAYARRVVERFLVRRAEELDVGIVLGAGDPSVPRQVFAPCSSQQKTDELVIRYAAPRFFPTLLLAPCAAHMLLVGRAEDLFRVNSEELFARVFAVPPGTGPGQDLKRSWVQSLRLSLLPTRFVRSPSHVPPRHPLDEGRGLTNALVICLVHAGDFLEKTVFTGLKARFVPGLEPWRRWERAAMLLPDDP